MKKILLSICCILFLVGCSNSETSDKDKTASEIQYLGFQIIDILDDLNNVKLEKNALISEKVSLEEKEEIKDSETESSEESGNNESQEEGSNMGEKEVFTTNMQMKGTLETDINNVNWSFLKNKIELINNTWIVLVQDLYALNSSETEITAFGNILNETILSINNEDKIKSLERLGNMYSYIPKFLETCSVDNQVKNISETKNAVLSAYIAVSTNNWTKAKEEVENSEEIFSNLIGDTQYFENKENKIAKTDILIKELKNSMQNQDTYLFLLKYTNLMETLNML